MIHRRAFVGHVRRLAQCKKSVGEAGRYPDLPAVAGLQRDAGPSRKVRRRATKINRDVEDDAAGRIHELPLRMLELKMQSAKDIEPRSAVIILRESMRQSELREPRLVEHFGEEAAQVVMD